MEQVVVRHLLYRFKISTFVERVIQQYIADGTVRFE